MISIGQSHVWTVWRAGKWGGVHHYYDLLNLAFCSHFLDSPSQFSNLNKSSREQTTHIMNPLSNPYWSSEVTRGMHQTYVCSFSNWETGCGRMWTVNVSASNHSQWDNPLDSLLCLGASGSLCIQYLSTGRPCKRDCMKPHGEKHHRRAVGSPSSLRCSFTTSTSHLPLTSWSFPSSSRKSG